MKDSTLRKLAEKARDWMCTCDSENGLHTKDCLTPLEQLKEESVLAVLPLLERIEKLRAALRFSSGTDWAVIAEEALAADDKAQGS